MADPIIINKNNTVIGGHFRLKILKEKGINEIDVRVPDIELTEEQEKELNLRLNKNLGEWDIDALSNFDEDMLKDVGFTSEELDKIFQLETHNEDDVPEKRETDIKPGDFFWLGTHKLLCGDAENEQDVKTLMQGQKADLVFTDPPYNVDYEGYTKNKLKIESDNSTIDEFSASLDKWFKSYLLAIKKGASLYICHPSRYQREFENALNINGINVRCQIIWANNTFAWGLGRYKFQHEPIFYCHLEGETDSWYGDKTQSTLWQVKKPNANKLHPTMKPIELIELALMNSSKREDEVIDFFGGSGSTLIACEKLKRNCRMMEKDPIYCQVIIDRWEQFTGKKAEKCQEQVAQKE